MSSRKSLAEIIDADKAARDLKNLNTQTTTITKTTQDYTTLLKKLELMFKPLIDGATAQAQATKDIADAQKMQAKKTEEANKVLREQTENYLDATAETQRFKDGLMEVRRQITEVTHVTKGMDKSMFQAMSQSKAWTAGSRLLSGTGLWSVQNALRGVIDVVSIYQTAQEKKMEITQKAAKAMENYGEVEEDYRLKAAKNAKLMADAKATGDYEELSRQNLSFQLMVKRGVAEADALKLLELEVDAMDELLDRQNKLIYGGKIRQAIKAKAAQLELKIMPKIKGVTDKLLRGGDDKTGGLLGQKWKPGRDAIKWTKESLKEAQDKGEVPLDTAGNAAIEGSERIAGRDEQKSGLTIAMENFEKQWIEGPDGRKRKASMLGSAEIIQSKSKDWAKGKIGNRGIVSALKGEKDKVGNFWTKHGEKTKTALGVITGLPMIWKLWKARGAITSAISDKFRKILPAMGFVFNKIKMGFMYFFMAIIAVFVVVKVIQMAWGAMKDYGDLLKEAGLKGAEIGFRIVAFGQSLFKWLGSLWKIVYSAFTGDFDSMIDGLIEFAINTGFLLLDLLLLAASLTFTLAVGIFFGFVNWIKKPGHMTKLLKGITTVLAIWGTWMLVKWIVAAVASYLLGIWGVIPVFFAMLGLVILGAIAILIDEIVLFFTKIWDSIIGIPGQIARFMADVIPGLATGGTIQSGGVAVVGERGPELVSLPTNSVVYSHQESKKLTNRKQGSGLSGTTNITVNVNGRLGASDRELRDLAKKVGSMINTEISRTTSSVTRSI